MQKKVMVMFSDAKLATIKEALGEEAAESISRISYGFKELDHYQVMEIISALCEKVKRLDQKLFDIVEGG